MSYWCGSLLALDRPITGLVVRGVQTGLARKDLSANIISSDLLSPLYTSGHGIFSNRHTASYMNGKPSIESRSPMLGVPEHWHPKASSMQSLSTSSPVALPKVKSAVPSFADYSMIPARCAHCCGIAGYPVAPQAAATLALYSKHYWPFPFACSITLTNPSCA